VTHELSPALSHLADRINAEHAQAETALRTGLEHARNVGLLLLEAKAQCAHGRWVPWLESNVRFSVRTAQAYMRVAQRWHELEAKAQPVALLTFKQAVKLLADPAPEEAAAGAGSPPLGVYLAQEALSEHHLHELAKLQDVYGAGLLRQMNPEFDWDSALRTAEDAVAVLLVLRPEEAPAYLPLTGKPLSPVVIEATRSFLEHAARFVDAKVPQWEVAAFWWASMAVIHGLPVGDLAFALYHWRERYQTALGWFYVFGRLDENGMPETSPQDAALAWGFWADLKHSGSLDRAKKLTASDLIQASEWWRSGSYVKPSVMQPHYYDSEEARQRKMDADDLWQPIDG
jgi:hypothetical protein